ncbi:MAG: peptide chain release factor N(5)-glutamine methyltransferase [Cyclobacteriaceae bacterium]
MRTVFSKDLQVKISGTLSGVYPKNEGDALALMLLEKIFGTSRTDLLVNAEMEFAPENVNFLKQAIDRLLANEPIQHILGEADFYGRQFKVSADVLVPRQETEELIRLIVNENKQNEPKILDIGTGSGCIACSLAKEIAGSEVHALDVSEQALEIAKGNNHLHQARVVFSKLDVLTQELPEKGFDIIVSNPPYVLESEKATMHWNVLDFDPHLALFVDDEDPLLFYHVIADKSRASLKKGGRLYFEINEKFGSEISGLLADFAYDKVTIHQDLHGKDRFVSGMHFQ